MALHQEPSGQTYRFPQQPCSPPSDSSAFLLRCAKSLLIIFIVAISIRVWTSWQVLHNWSMERFWAVAEEGAVAKAIVSGGGFSSPYDGGQPTAWLAPGYPFVVALVFRLFGVYSLKSTWVLVGLNTLFAGLTSAVIYLVGKKTFGRDAGVAAAWLWALCLPDAVMSLLMWDTCVSALLMITGFLLLVPLQDSTDYRAWGRLGLFNGAACLINPALISPLPFFFIHLWCRHRRMGRNVWRQVLLSAVLFLVVLAPWLVRNYRTFGQFVFVRGNFAAELYFGNLGFNTHPLGGTMEYQRMGELAYVKNKQKLAFEYIRGHPGEFVMRSARRAASFWTVPRIARGYWLAISILSLAGLALAIREQGVKALPFLVVLLVYPLTYYITYVWPKYRHPIEPLMFVLTAYALTSISRLAVAKVRRNIV